MNDILVLWLSMHSNKNLIKEYPKKAYKKLAIPLSIFAVFNSFFLLIDTIWATMLGVEALMIVGLGCPLFILITKFGETLGHGTNYYISRSLGANNLNNARNTLIHGIMIGLIISFIYAIVNIVSIDVIFDFLNLNTVVELARLYIIPLVLCSFVFILTHFFSETLQSEGDSKIPTTSMICGNIIKFILSPIFIFYFKLGIFSLALSTIIGLLVPLFIFIYIYFFKRNIRVYFDMNCFKINLNIFKEIFKVSIPNFIDRSLFTGLTFFINYLFIFIGDPTGIAFYTFYQKIFEFISSPARGASRGLLTVSAFLYGSKKINDIRSLYKFSLLFTTIISLISICVFIIFHLSIPNLFGFDFNFYEGINFIIIGLSIINIILPVSFCSCKIFDGLGKSIYGLIGSCLLLFLIIGLNILNVIILDLGESHILISFVLAELIVTVYYLVLIQHIFKGIFKINLSTIKVLRKPNLSKRMVLRKPDFFKVMVLRKPDLSKDNVLKGSNISKINLFGVLFK